MTTDEFSREFDIMYNTASFGAPDLNSYEKSLFLTQAVRDIVLELYSNYEHTEFNKRALNPLVKDSGDLIITTSSDYYQGLTVSEITLPADIYYILKENVKTSSDCDIDLEVIAEDLDTLNKTVKNPFKKPNKRKVLRVSDGGNKIKLYSSETITNYKVKYLKKYSPIVLTDFATDTELVGDETIDGIAIETNTELPVFLHDKIVKRGVILAIKSLRENNLKTQIEV